MSTVASQTHDETEIIDKDHFALYGYPHDAWRALRREDPVHYWDRGYMPFWAVTKHADITAIGKDPTTFISSDGLVITDREPERNFDPPPTIIEMDPPVHNAYRKIVAKRFTPGALRKIHADIERIARQIVDDLIGEGDEGEVDFVEKVAAPLPIAVIAWLLGVPDSDWRLLFDWTNRALGSADPEYRREGASTTETREEALVQIYDYFAKLVEEKRRKPADDLVTLFTRARVDGRPLEPMEVLSYCQIIMVAGNETTRNGTTGGMLALIEHPEELRRVQARPELLKPAVEEMLRWTSPIIHFARTATRDVELRGRKIARGERLALFYPSANRDEEVFDDPYDFRIDRIPNRHLAFGVGEHFCAGAHVARLEMQMAFRFLLPRIEEIELAGPPERLRSNLIGGIKHLPVRYKLKAA